MNNYLHINMYLDTAFEKYRDDVDKGNITKKEFYKRCFVLARLFAQGQVEQCISIADDYNYIRRMKTRFDHQGVTIIPLNNQLEEISNTYRFMNCMLALAGKIISENLDGWQLNGATYDDLFNFCCCSSKMIEKINQSLSCCEDKFSNLVYIFSPDYKDNDGVCDLNKSAPLTHSINRYVIERVKALKETNTNENTDMFYD